MLDPEARILIDGKQQRRGVRGSPLWHIAPAPGQYVTSTAGPLVPQLRSRRGQQGGIRHAGEQV